VADNTTVAILKNVTVGTASTPLLVANHTRRQFIIYNDSGKAVSVAYATIASLTSFTRVITPNSSHQSELNDYTGPISAVVASGTAVVRVTEISTL